MNAIILAGGLGQRLRPFTAVLPKPLLPIGESSVLEIQLLTLKRYGVERVFIATNYLSEVVSAYIGDGSRFGMSVEFSKEDAPLGTCGPLSLLRHRLDESFILMNGDILTTLDFRQAYEFGTAADADLTVVTKELVTPFAFGRVLSHGQYISGIQEKPDIKFEILAGIYIVKPTALTYVPHNTYYNMDSLIKDLLKNGRRVGRYLMTEYWLDIGTAQHYEDAQSAYEEHFGHLRPRTDGLSARGDV
jgi:NDP-sugar pyrophosphorylase family protein